MELILLKDVDKLGKRGEVVTVKDGYARNFLLPSGVARPNTPGNVQFVEALKAREAARLEEELQAAKALSEKLASFSLTIRVQVGEGEKLYGSVTAQDIANALQEDGISVDRKKILLEQPIKSLGVFQVPLRIHPEVGTLLKVWVVKE